MDYVITAALLSLSALFSGLTLGLMGLDLYALKRKARLGNKNAARIVPIREHGNHLLTTLLLGNVAVNAVLAIFLGSIASGLVAGIVATTLIFLLGEIIPQAVMSRHALSLGAHTAPFVSVLMKMTWPITFPIGAALDRALGEELPTLYTKRELMEIISEHEDSERSAIDRDEERIVHGALQFSHKTVHDIMTPRKEVKCLHATQVLDDTLRRKITKEGFSRLPVLEGDPELIIGILYAKNLLITKESATVKGACERKHLSVRAGDKLDMVLAYMLKRRQHMAIVVDEIGVFLGIVTLEDIIEEVIQQEILDENDDENMV